MKSYALLTILMTFCLSAPECHKHGTRPSPEEATQIRQAIVTYLECEECMDGESEAVVKLGRKAVPTLAAALSEGPSNVQLELLRRHITTTYRKLKEYELTHPETRPLQSEEFYVKLYTNNYVALHQSRAAMALGAIGGAEAKRALEEATRMSLRADVQAAVKASLEKMK
jgi:hypothetical protein